MSKETSSLSEIITVKRIFEVKETPSKTKATEKRKVKAPQLQKLRKGSMAKPKPKETKTVPDRKKLVRKNSIVNAIDKLKTIEEEVCEDDDNFLNKTNKEIEISYQQLEAINRIIMEKLKKFSLPKEIINKNCNKSVGVDCESQTVTGVAKLKTKFERIRNKYDNKPQVHYKSVKDIKMVNVDEDGNLSNNNKQSVYEAEQVESGESVNLFFNNNFSNDFQEESEDEFEKYSVTSTIDEESKQYTKSHQKQGEDKFEKSQLEQSIMKSNYLSKELNYSGHDFNLSEDKAGNKMKMFRSVLKNFGILYE